MGERGGLIDSSRLPERAADLFGGGDPDACRGSGERCLSPPSAAPRPVARRIDFSDFSHSLLSPRGPAPTPLLARGADSPGRGTSPAPDIHTQSDAPEAEPSEKGVAREEEPRLR